MKHRWLEIAAPTGTQYIRADQVVGVMPVQNNGVTVLGMAALLVQGMPGPLVVGINPAKAVEELGRDDAPPLSLRLEGCK